MNPNESPPASGPDNPKAEQAPQPAIPPKVLGGILQATQSLHSNLVAEIAVYPGSPENEAYYVDVKLQGTIDATSQEAQITWLRGALLLIAKRGEVAGICLNFEQVESVDLDLQAQILLLNSSLSKLQKPLMLHSLPVKEKAEPFEITDLDRVLKIAADIRSALLLAMEPTEPTEQVEQ